ncbi:sugar ABC transporter ATP-binding protein [Lachnospiraceae bacterium 38-10]
MKSSQTSREILRTVGVSKEYPGVKALSNVDFDLLSGEVHILLGENGAGKSTFTQIVAGAVHNDNGEIYLDRKKVNIKSCLHAQELGVGMVFQESHLLPLLTVAENIFCGHEPLKKGEKGPIDWNYMREKSAELLGKLGYTIDVNAKVGQLNLVERRMVEFAKALSQNCKVMILDEPTASLSAKETEQLFTVIRELKKQNVGIIYISHRLDEVKRIGDRVTVFRNGAKIKTLRVADTDTDELIELMVGRKMESIYPWEERQIGETVMKVEGFTHPKYFQNISFSLHRGEILGICGLKGSGKSEILRAIFGDLKISDGKMEIAGKMVTIHTPSQAIQNKMAYVPADRRREGLNLNFDIVKNTTIASMKKFTVWGLLSDKKELAAAQQYKEQLQIKTPTVKKMVRQLSGGNQQKVVLAKWLSSDAQIIIFEEPTNGIDVGAKFEFHQLIMELAKSGTAVILMSSDLPELVGMSDRVLVMKEGSIVGRLEHAELTQEKVLQYAT